MERPAPVRLSWVTHTRRTELIRRTLRAEDERERTVKSYTEAVRPFDDFLAARGHPLTVDAITRDGVRAFIADQLERWKPLTALNRYRASRHSSSGRWPRASWTSP